jgi:hypothetical protein
MKRLLSKVVGGILGLAIVYAIVAETVFIYRHPWMTENEHLAYLPQAMTFQTVEYSQARSR